ncbi:hypothetical protein MHK_004887 [Candidatus Magnetomorum sp. HK-1]|nr:hypothetical protein MHK_004887 [Candidatus Magnetomorum sp. HK-1]
MTIVLLLRKSMPNESDAADAKSRAADLKVRQQRAIAIKNEKEMNRNEKL